ncbi:tetratricopeptide repeat protein [bacterium]|nr:tetratricopeptide repeat protein [bacterium]
MTDNQVLPRHRPIIRLFVSSTFTDFKHERDVLQREVFLKLERHCAKRQFQFHAVDLRWGVPTEANKDHRTMRICFEELRRSQEISPQPNFLILMGNRYGWQPLPEEISEDEFNQLHRVALPDRERTILGEWYNRDDNALPPVYILQSRKIKRNDGRDYTDDEVWKGIQSTLWDIINRAYPDNGLAERFAHHVALDQPLPSVVRFQASATEQEIWRGALGAPNTKEHVLAFIREIENLADFPQADQIGQFVDVEKHEVNAVSQTALNDLKTEVIKRLGDGNIITSDPVRLLLATDRDGRPSADVSTEHLPEMCTRIYTALESIIDRQMNEYWDTEGTDVAPSRLLELERNEHRLFGRERAPIESFVGRQRPLETIGDYINNQTQGLLVIHGASGCGKTALLARAAQEVAPERHPIVRFIGVTPHTSDIRSLLSSLCQELRERHPIDSPLPTEYQPLAQELLQHLNAATAEEPVILFLDALDQLADSDDGRSLHWLPTDLLPEHAKVIVSCLSERAPEDPAGRPYAALRERVLSDKNFIDLDALAPEEARELLFDRWLPQAGRRLDAEQSETVARQMEKQSCRAPLYLKILFEEARLWRSSEPVPELGDDVPALLGDLLDRLGDSSNHGITVERALGYIASARRGLAELEILEVLYRDPEYRSFLDRVTEKTGHTLPDIPPRIPIAIWARLRSDLAPYLSEQAAPGATVLNFYHRQMSETVRGRFLKGEKRCRHFHTSLSEYFDSRNLDSRKVDELPWQLADGTAWQRLYELLSDADFLRAIWIYSGYDVKTYWARIEESSNLTQLNGYRDAIECPESEPDKKFLGTIALLLFDTGHLDESFELAQHLIEYHRQAYDARRFLACLTLQSNILQLRGRFIEALQSLQEAEQFSRQIGDKTAIMISIGNQAPIYLSQGNLDCAMEKSQQQELISRELGSMSGLQASLGNQGMVLYRRRDFDAAMAKFKNQTSICRESGNMTGLSTSLNNQALVHMAQGNRDVALRLHEEAARICLALGDKDGLQASLGNQAEIHGARGDPDKAISLLSHQELLCRELGNKGGLQVSLANQASLHYNRNNLEKAMSVLKEQEQICSELGSKKDLQACIGRQAAIASKQGNPDRSLMLLMEEEQLCRTLNDRHNLQSSLGNQVLMLYEIGDFCGAMTRLKEQETLCRELGEQKALRDNLARQAGVHYALGDLNSAMDVLEEDEQLCVELQDMEGLQESLGHQAKILHEWGELDTAMMAYGAQESICRRLEKLDSLARSLKRQSEILCETTQFHKASRKAREAFELASRHGFSDLRLEIEAVLKEIRQQIDE